MFWSFRKPKVYADPTPPPKNTHKTEPYTSKKNCGHDCQLTDPSSCCSCGDKRPHQSSYEAYVDGVGFVNSATRSEYYCPECKDSSGEHTKKTHASYKPKSSSPYKEKPAQPSPAVQASNANSYQPSYYSEPEIKTHEIPIHEWHCNHCPVPTDCRICESDHLDEKRAFKYVIDMGFTNAETLKALNILKSLGQKANEELLLSHVLDARDKLDEQKKKQEEEKKNKKEEVMPPLPPQQAQGQAQAKHASTHVDECIVCFVNTINAVLVPCGHLAMCHGCGDKLLQLKQGCPVCRTAITMVVKTYRI